MKYVNMYSAKAIYKEIDSWYRYERYEETKLREMLYDEEWGMTYDSYEMMLDNLRQQIAYEVDYVIFRYEKGGRNGNFIAELEAIGML